MFRTNLSPAAWAAIRIAFVLSFCLTSYASSLPAPATVAECTGSLGLIDDPNSCTMVGTNAVGSASLTLSPFVNLTAQTNSGPADQNGVYSAGALALVTYSFQVIGGNPGDVVPIVIAANLTSNGSSFSHGYGFAEVTVHTNFGNSQEAVCSNTTCGTTNTSFLGTFGWTSSSGETGDTIQISAEADSGDSAISEFANASASSFVYIDPGFAGASNYSIIFSDGVGNALPDVPEPGSFGLTGAALVALAIVLRAARTAATWMGWRQIRLPHHSPER